MPEEPINLERGNRFIKGAERLYRTFDSSISPHGAPLRQLKPTPGFEVKLGIGKTLSNIRHLAAYPGLVRTAEGMETTFRREVATTVATHKGSIEELHDKLRPVFEQYEEELKTYAFHYQNRKPRGGFEPPTR